VLLFLSSDVGGKIVGLEVADMKVFFPPTVDMAL